LSDVSFTIEVRDEGVKPTVRVGKDKKHFITENVASLTEGAEKKGEKGMNYRAP
jgi:hypothetical protein